MRIQTHLQVWSSPPSKPTSEYSQPPKPYQPVKSAHEMEKSNFISPPSLYSLRIVESSLESETLAKVEAPFVENNHPRQDWHKSIASLSLLSGEL